MRQLIAPIGALMLLFLITSCKKEPLQHLEGRYTVDYVEYNNKNVTDSAHNYRFGLFFKGYLSPSVPEFKGLPRTSLKALNSVDITSIEEEEESYILIKNGGFLTGKYRVRCQDQDCCKLALRNELNSIVVSMNLRNPSDRNYLHTCSQFDKGDSIF